MNKSKIYEGKTRQEAIEKGLKELKVSKNQVEIKDVVEEGKRSFYSILEPRVVKIEMTVKDGANKKEAKPDKRVGRKEKND